MNAAGNDALARAQAGDREALGELLLAHERRCYDLALWLTGSPADAEDVCQDAFTRALRDIGAGTAVRDFRSWLLSIVVCAHRDRLDSEVARRRRERSRSAMVSGASATAAASSLDRKELRRQLEVSLRRLDEDYRLPIVLHHEQGLTCAEAARVLGMPEGTVKTNIKRGLEELKGLMTAAGYACTVPAMTGALAEGLAVSVPAGLTAFIQSLTVAAESGAAAVGKAAAGAALKISARLGTKKAAGLALGWKVGAVLTAAAIGGAAVVAVKNGMFEAGRPAPVVTAPQPPEVPVSAGLAGWWKFDEGAGDVAHDLSGNGNHGRISGAEWTEGRFGKALLLDGTGRMEVPWSESLAATRGATIAAWVRILDRPGAGDRGMFLHIGQGQLGERRWNYRLSLAKEHTFKLSHSWELHGVREATADCGAWPEGWFHVAFSVTADDGDSHAFGDSYAAYMDGRMLAPSQVAPQHVLQFTRLEPRPGEPLVIEGLSRGFRAVVDEVRVYTRRLDAEEVTRLAEESAP